MPKRLFSTKPIGELHEADDANELKRTLDARALVLLGIGAIIGTGIFVLTGTAAANHAGPALVVSFLIAGLGCAFAGLCYAEFASMIPVAGSAYSYSYATLGEGVAWFIGWNLILEYLFAAATVAVGWSGYVVSLVEQFGFMLPDALTNAPFTKGAGHFEIVRTGAVVNLPAVLVIAAITALCYVGIHQSARFNSIVVAIKVTVIVLFIGFGMWVVDGANWTPFIPENAGEFGRFGWSGVVQAAGIIFFAYIGFDAVSTAAQEAKNPQRDMPIGILASLAVCTVLYVAVAAVLTGMVHYSQLNSSGADRGRTRPAPGTRVARRLDQARRDRGHDLGDAGDDARAAAHLLRDVPRRPPPAPLPQGAPDAPDPVRGHADHRDAGGADRRPVPGDDPGRTRVDRHAAGLHDRLPRRAEAALFATRPAAPVQGPGTVVRLHRRRADLRRHDGFAPARHLAAPAGLDHHRVADLRLLRLPSQRTAPSRPLTKPAAAQRSFAARSMRVATSDATMPPASVPTMMPSDTMFGTWYLLTSSIFTPTKARISTRL